MQPSSVQPAPQAVYPQLNPQQQGTQPGPQVFVYPQQAPQQGVNNKFPSQAATVLGVIQLTIGVACVIINIVALALYGRYSYNSGIHSIGSGFWAGLTIIVAGILGIVAGRKKTQCPIVGFMVMSIISAVFTTGLVAQGAIALVISSFNYWYIDKNAELGMGIALLLLGAIELFIAIASSVICCVGVCCRPSVNQPGYVVSNAQYSAGGAQPVYITAQGQPYVQPVGVQPTGGQPMYVVDQSQQRYVQPGPVGQGYETKQAPPPY